VRAKEYAVMRRAVEDALEGAIPRFDKHRDVATVPALLQREMALYLADAVLNGICEWFYFPEATE
jgi:hypothetical protein